MIQAAFAGFQCGHWAYGISSLVGLPCGSGIPHCSRYLQCVRSAGHSGSPWTVDCHCPGGISHFCRAASACSALGQHAQQSLLNPQGLFPSPASGLWYRLQCSFFAGTLFLPSSTIPWTSVLPFQAINAQLSTETCFLLKSAAAAAQHTLISQSCCALICRTSTV